MAPFRDAWEVVKPDEHGITFSNFIDNRITDSARIDRILARQIPDNDVIK